MKKKSIGLLLASAYLFHARSRQKSLKACLFEDSLRLSQIARLERNPKVTKAFYHWQRSLNEQVTLPKHLRSRNDSISYDVSHVKLRYCAYQESCTVPAWWGLYIESRL